MSLILIPSAFPGRSHVCASKRGDVGGNIICRAAPKCGIGEIERDSFVLFHDMRNVSTLLLSVLTVLGECSPLGELFGLLAVNSALMG